MRKTSYRLTIIRQGLSVLAVLGLAACAATPKDGADPYQALTDIDVSLAAMLLQRTLDHAPDGTTRRWTNDQSGHSGAITPVRSYIATGGQFCRDYQEDISIGEERQQFHYSACRDENRWGL